MITRDEAKRAIFNASKNDKSSPKNCIHLLILHSFIDKIYDSFEEAIKPKTCEWKQCNSEYDTSWEGTCSVKWLLIDGTPTENHMKFCPQCGGKLIGIEPKEQL